MNRGGVAVSGLDVKLQRQLLVVVGTQLVSHRIRVLEAVQKRTAPQSVNIRIGDYHGKV